MLYDYLTAIIKRIMEVIGEGFFKYGNEYSERAGCNGEVMDRKNNRSRKFY